MRQAPKLNWLRIAEFLLLLGTCVSISCYVFLGLDFRVVALLVPALLYAALRFEAAGLACATLFSAIVALYALAWQAGPFRHTTDIAEELMMMHMRTSVCFTSLLILAAVMAERKAYRLALEEANRQLELLAGTDGLTRVSNRRQFDLRLQEEFDRACQGRDAFSLLLIDVDHFKQYNDRFGHPAGDKVLKQVARLLQQQARGTDLVARYGGEEFAVLLPSTDKQAAITAAERCRQAMLEGVRAHAAITVSIGISTFTHAANDPKTSDLKTFVDAADQALYQSKRHGRNRCLHADDEVPTAAI
jgi:diguanylate cyclase (GGDEF)-like protein